MKGICIAHGKRLETLKRNAQTWFPALDSLEVISPEDDPIEGAELLGESCWAGAGNLARIRAAVKKAAQESIACVLDYDVVFPPIRIPDKIVKDGVVLCSETYMDDEGGKFTYNIYGHCPWIATGKTWKRILAKDDGQIWEHGFTDRWLAVCCVRAGIELLPMRHGFSQYGEWNNKDRERAVESNALIYHGVKSELDFISCFENISLQIASFSSIRHET